MRVFLRLSPFLLVFSSVAPSFAADCGRGCLTGVLNQYMNAVVQHKPEGVALSPGYRQTENAVVTRPGEGIWKTAKGLGKVQRRYFDPVTGNAAFFGTVDETSGNAAVVTLRIKVEDQKVTEAEWYLARKGDPGIGVGAGPQANAAFWDPEYLAAHAPAERIVSKSERVSRNDLIAITNSYFDSLSARNGHIMIAHPGCLRLENGVSTTQRPAPANTTPASAGIFKGETDCMHEDAMRNIFSIVARRFPVVDEEAGVVLGLGVFLRKPGVAMRRNAFSEWFYIDQGKIRSIYSSMFYPDQEAMVPNWLPFDGSWPVLVAPK